MGVHIFLFIIEISFFGYFFYVAFYNLVLSAAGHFVKDRSLSMSTEYKKIAIILPCYKEDNIILDTVECALKAEYPVDLFKVIVVADSFHSDTLRSLAKYPIEIVEIELDQSTKVKAINEGLRGIRFEAEILVVLDADNVMESQFLWKVNSLFHEGYKIVQGRRMIKNKLNDLTYLDDISEQISNHINRKGSCSLRGSSSIAGSGFAVDYKLGCQIFAGLDSVGGFDKEFELELIKRGFKTKYIENLKIYDEKVKSNVDFENQRIRWIASQYHFLRKNVGEGLKALVKGDFAFFNSSILRNIQLPRLLNLGLLTIVIGLIILFRNTIIIAFSAWLVVYIAFLISIILAIPKWYYSFKLLKTISRLPVIFLMMFKIMFRLKGANKVFIHTPHYKTPSIDE